MNREEWEKCRSMLFSVAERLREKGVTVEGPEILPPVDPEQIVEFECETGLKLPAEFAEFLKLTGGFTFYWCLIGDNGESLKMNGQSPMASFGGLPDMPFVGIEEGVTLLKVFRDFQKAEIETGVVADSSLTDLRKCFPLAYDNGNYLVIKLDTDRPEIHYLDHELSFRIFPEGDKHNSSFVASGFGEFLRWWAGLGCPGINDVMGFKEWFGGSFDLSTPRAVEWMEWLVDSNAGPKTQGKTPPPLVQENLDIFIHRSGKQSGPYSIEQVTRLLSGGYVEGNDFAWRRGTSHWQPLHALLGLKPPQSNHAEATIRHSVNATGAPAGVGGFLLFFCIILTILHPLATSISVFGSWLVLRDISDVSLTDKVLRPDNLCELLLSAYGFFVGVRIWSGSPKGRTFARRYLALRLLGSIGMSAFTVFLIIGLPIEATITMWIRVFISVAGWIGYFTIWWMYFAYSKRVMNTYG